MKINISDLSFYSYILLKSIVDKLITTRQKTLNKYKLKMEN